MYIAIPTSKKSAVNPKVDPYFNNVSLLLHMNGENGGSVFTDNSPRPKTANFIDNPITRTDKFKFPPSSFFGDATTSINGSAIWFNSNQDFGFGTGEFTIEFFLNTTYRTQSRRTVMSFGESTGSSAKIAIYDAKLEWYTYSSYVFKSTDVANGGWMHIAITRKNSTYYLFVDGKKVSESATAGSVDMPANLLIVGAGNRGALNRIAFPGWLDEVRITNGVARYTADFTPPTEPFPDS